MGTNGKEKTVFILGAGASYNYGFPLGNELRYDILSKYPGALNAIQRLMGERTNFLSQSQHFLNRFKLSSDKSIDLFLSKFPDYELAGKVAIIYNILQAENTSVFREDLINRKKMNKQINDDWLLDLYSALTKDLNTVQSIEDLNFDHVSFVSFNYDRSLEYFLSTSFSNGINFTKIGGNTKLIMDRIKIEHVYGKVADLPIDHNDIKVNGLSYRNFNVDVNPISDWIDNIRVIYDRHEADMNKIHKLISEASKIYFLGFGYDVTNLKLIGVPEILSQDQTIYGTAVGSYPEEIDAIKKLIRSPNYKYDPAIFNCNCTELLRRFYLVNI